MLKTKLTTMLGIKHPIIQPIEFDTRNGLSPDEVAVLAVHLGGSHHYQPLHTVGGVQPDCAMRRRGRLIQPHQYPAAWLARRALEDFLAVLAEQFLRSHAE